MQRARRLFARVLEAPGGLRIQTIHGFAQTLLAAFPAEAGISPGFRPIEGRAEQRACPPHAGRSARRRRGDRQRSADRRRPGAQPAPRREGRRGLSDALRPRRARRSRALGAPDAIEAWLRELIGLPEGDDRRLSRRRAAATTASTATCCARSPTPTATGAQRPARASPKRSTRWLALDAAERAADAADLALGRRSPSNGELRKVSVGPGQGRPRL